MCTSMVIHCTQRTVCILCTMTGDVCTICSVLDSHTCHAHKQPSMRMQGEQFRAAVTFWLFSRPHGRQPKNRSCTRWRAAHATPLGMWQVCRWGRVAPPARSAWLTGGASAKGVNLGILYIQIYIQICSILCMRAHEARTPEAGSDGSMS